MALTWKDLIATIFTGLTAYVAYLSYAQAKMPYLANYRWGVALLGVVGLAVCAFASVNTSPSTMTTLLSGLGIIAFLAVVVGLITNSQIAFLALAATIIVLWLLTTVRHLVS
jgi:hypothetical protein